MCSYRIRKGGSGLTALAHFLKHFPREKDIHVIEKQKDSERVATE
jgi:hypothetical protein